MQQLLSSLEDERQRQFRRLVVVSAALHVALAVLFWLNPTLHHGTALPAVVQVDLVTMADIAPAPKPAPEPAPVPAKPPPPPPPPPEVKKVLPKQPAPLPKPKPVEAKPKPKPKPEAKPKEEPKKPPEPAPEQDYEDVLAQLRKEAGETTPKPVETVQAQPASGPTGLGQLVSPEVARWIRDVKMKVTQAWILAPGFRMQPLETQLEVQIGPTGEVRGMRITQSSGNPWFDESVERAIQKASPLPAPPEAGEYPFSFKPSDLL
jgi:colicin import membrane protein